MVLNNKVQKLKAIDFFCSGGGMSFGMQQAGIDVIAGIDFDPECKETYESNIKGAKYILADVSTLKEADLSNGVHPFHLTHSPRSN